MIISDDTVGGTVNGVNNGNLDVPGIQEGAFAPPWKTNEYRTVSGPTGPTDTGSFTDFANHTPGPKPPGSAVQVGLWAKSFAGNINDTANLDLYQDNPGTVGMKYTLTGWAKFEQYYTGGLNSLVLFDPDGNPIFPFTPSPTRTYFALDFLDGLGNAPPAPAGSVIELKQDGQVNNQGWKQHMLMAVAPAGTVTVRARASMRDGLNYQGAQSAFFDDFNLTCTNVPEPASIVLGLVAAVGALGLVRRRS